ncbi:sucrase ferredoxin [Acaryochloris marina]|uniref:Sucrase ferredoxin n=1 Tax=Acaryochloris marina (strain MBIC 11017) TaxID=329726 RepID=A8ZKG6_ACAM1|nr:sucrase ferredoxin [Acaryochloris marina]ABW31666.1 conserved hypothetical protein [Acaryochloris marina MBIC11017]
MLTQTALSDCRFCSLVSKQNGEDPIGTARTVDHWLLIELAQPWIEKMFKEDPRIAPLIKLFRHLFTKYGVVIQPILIAPDKVYSRPGETRIIYFHRAQKLFTQYKKQEFIVPEAEFPRLVTALLKHLMKQPNEFSAFHHFRQETTHIREILVCTHGNVDAACARFGYPIYKNLREGYATQPNNHLRVWRCSHFGGHKFAPTLIDLPRGHYWGHLEPEIVDLLVNQQGEVAKLRSHYRGWSGLSKFEQIAERDIWMREGWDWLTQDKSGKTTRKGLIGIKRYLYPLLKLIPLKRVQFFLEQWTRDAIWAEVQIQFTSPDQTRAGTYFARVEMSESVMTAGKSPKLGEAVQLKPVPQYRLSRLVKLK